MSDSTTVTVRPASEGDLDHVLRLYDELAEGGSASLPIRHGAGARYAELRSQPGRLLLVAEAGGAVRGTADLLIVPNLTNGGRPWMIIENVIVDGRFRRQGIGKALMEAVIRRAVTANCYKIQFLSRKDRTDAHAFYGRFGFESLAEGFRRYFE